jgi:hypothetical protein
MTCDNMISVRAEPVSSYSNSNSVKFGFRSDTDIETNQTSFHLLRCYNVLDIVVDVVDVVVVVFLSSI